MNDIEVSKLLALMALADNRKPPEDDEARMAMIEFWLGMVGDLRYADAAIAVRDHYRESREWVMPADIRQRVAEIRKQRIEAAPPVEIPEHLADRPLEARDWKQRTLAAIADGADPQLAIGSGQ
jgi:hypothetical protein